MKFMARFLGVWQEVHYPSFRWATMKLVKFYLRHEAEIKAANKPKPKS